jgi:hypothetical protein
MTLRTINKAYEELRVRDPETAITKNLLREMVTQGIIPSAKAGNRYLVDVDVVEQYFMDTTHGLIPAAEIKCSRRN